MNIFNPKVYTAIVHLAEEAVICVEEENNPDLSSQQKEDRAIQLFNDSYKEANLIFDFPDAVDIIAKELPGIIKSVVSFLNVFGIFKYGNLGRYNVNDHVK